MSPHNNKQKAKKLFQGKHPYEKKSEFEFLKISEILEL